MWRERRVHVASSLKTTVDALEQIVAPKPPGESYFQTNPTRRLGELNRSAIETYCVILRGLNVALDDMLFDVALDDMLFDWCA